MAIKGALDTINILFSAKMDASDVTKKTKELERQLEKSQETFDRNGIRRAKYMGKNSSTVSNYYKKEMSERQKIINTEKSHIKLINQKIGLLTRENTYYKLSSKSLKENTSLMGRMTGMQLTLSNEVAATAIAREKSLRAQKLGVQFTLKELNYEEHRATIKKKNNEITQGTISLTTSLIGKRKTLINQEEALARLAKTRNDEMKAAHRVRTAKPVKSGFAGLQDRGDEAIDEARAQKKLKARQKTVEVEKTVNRLGVVGTNIQRESVAISNSSVSLMGSLIGKRKTLINQEEALARLAQTRHNTLMASYRLRQANPVKSGYAGLQDRGDAAIDEARAQKKLKARQKEEESIRVVNRLGIKGVETQRRGLEIADKSVSLMGSLSGKRKTIINQEEALVRLAKTRHDTLMQSYRVRQKEASLVKSGFSGLQERGDAAGDKALADKKLRKRQEQALAKEDIALKKKQSVMSQKIATVTDKVTNGINEKNRVKQREILIGLRAQAIKQKNSDLARKLHAEIKKQTKLIDSDTVATKRNNAAKTKMNKSSSTGFMGTGGATPFPHKVSTTAQYAAAGAGIYAVAQAARAGVEAVIDFDTAVRTMSAVLGESLFVTKELGQELNDLGKKFGGNQKEIYDIATELGRAGVATEDLTEATEVAMKMALLTGDTFKEASKAIISYNTVFGKDEMGNVVYTVEELGDKLAYVANVSRLTTQDIGTFSNYALAAAKSVNLTVDAVGAMAASFSNAGINASTIGTQIRSFTRILTDESAGVNNLFRGMNLVQASVLTDIQKGGKASDDAMLQFGKQLKNLSDEDFSAFTAGLDIRARQSLATLRQQFDAFAGFLKGSAVDSKGQLDETSIIIESFASTWERSMNRMKDASVDILTPMFDGIKKEFNDMSYGMEWMAIQAKYAKDQTSFNMSGSINPIVKAMELVNYLQKEGASEAEQERAKALGDWQIRVQMQKHVDELQAGAIGERAIWLRDEITQYQKALDITVTQGKFKDRELEKQRIILAMTQLGGKITSDNAEKSATEMSRMVKLYTSLIDKKKEAGETGSEKPTTVSPMDIDINKFSKSIVAGAKARYDMTSYQKILNRLVKEQVNDSQKGLNITVKKNLGLTTEAKNITDIVNKTNNYKETTLAIAKLQAMSADATHRGRQTIALVIKQLEEQLSLQQAQQQSQQSINQEKLKGVNEEVKVLKDMAKVTDAEQLNRLGKISDIDLIHIKLKQQKKLLEDIEKTPVDNKLTNKKKIVYTKEVTATIVKLEADAANTIHNLRTALDDEYLKNRIENVQSYSTRMNEIFGSPRKWFVLSSDNENLDGFDNRFGPSSAQVSKERGVYKEKVEGANLSTDQQAQYMQEFDSSQSAKAKDKFMADTDRTTPWVNDFADRQNAIETFYSGEAERMQLAGNDKLAMMYEQGSTEAQLSLEIADQKEAQESLYRERKLEEDTAYALAGAAATSSIAGTLAQTMSDLQASGLVKSKKMFQAMQAMQIVAATADTYQNAILAYKRGLEIPYIGMVLGPINAAAAIAAGMANVAQIKAQTFHTGGTVGPNGQKLRSDEVPAVLQTGERVLSRQEVGQAKQAPTNNETVIINSIDPAVIESYMTSRSGRKVINNVVNA